MDKLLDWIGIFGIIVLCIAIAIMAVSICISLYRTIVYYRFKGYNKQKIECGLSAEQVATNIAENLNIPGIKVAPVKFWKGLFWGNHFDVKTNTIFLRKRLLTRNSLMAVATATKIVATAEMHNKGDKRIRKINIMSAFGVLAPIVFLPLIALGVILDFAISDSLGVITIVLLIIALAYFIFGMTAQSLKLQVEKDSTARALEYFQTTGVLNAEEQKDAKKLYKTQRIMMLVDYIYTVMYVVWLSFKLLKSILKLFSRKK